LPVAICQRVGTSRTPQSNTLATSFSTVNLTDPYLLDGGSRKLQEPSSWARIRESENSISQDRLPGEQALIAKA